MTGPFALFLGISWTAQNLLASSCLKCDSYGEEGRPNPWPKLQLRLYWRWVVLGPQQPVQFNTLNAYPLSKLSAVVPLMAI